MADSLSPPILISLDVNPSLRLGFSDFGTDSMDGQADNSNVLFWSFSTRDYKYLCRIDFTNSF